MKYKTVHSYLAVLAVLLILAVWGFTHLFGPIDSVPRLHASGQSSDGALRVKVYRKRISLLPSSEIDIIVKVFDRQDNLIYEKKIFQEAMWSELDNLFRNITFVGDEIRIGPQFSAYEYVVIRKADLNATQ